MIEIADVFGEAVHDAIEQDALVRFWRDPALKRSIPSRRCERSGPFPGRSTITERSTEPKRHP